MNKPTVTILSPCYNVERYLSECLESIVNQTYHNLQIVMIDDGSNDDTWKILQEYAAKDNRIEVYHQDNHGVAYTRNQLLDKIKGNYFLFVDSDDWMELDMVEFLVNRAIRERVDMVTCGMVMNDNLPKNIFPEERWTQERVVKEFLCHQTFGGSLWNKLIKTSLLHNEPRFHRGISYGEDALFTWELIKEAETGVVVTTSQLYHYRKNPDSISHAKWTPDKKGSNHIVWQTITDDCARTWPQYADIAKARYAIEDMWGLYYASLADYPHDDEIRMRQKHVRDSFPLIKQSGFISKNKLFFAWVVCRWYGFGGVLRVIRKIKGQDHI